MTVLLTGPPVEVSNTVDVGLGVPLGHTVSTPTAVVLAEATFNATASTPSLGTPPAPVT